MAQTEFDRKLDKIYARWQKILGHTIPKNARDSWEKEYSIGLYPDETLLEDLECALGEEIPRMKMLLASVKNDRNSTNVKPLPFAVKPVTIERRLSIVDFVEKNGRNHTNYRIGWGRAVAKWNEMYPYHKKTPRVLRAEYQRALREPGAKLQGRVRSTLQIAFMYRILCKKVITESGFYQSQSFLSKLESQCHEVSEGFRKNILSPYRELPYRPKFLRDSIILLGKTIIDIAERQLEISQKLADDAESKVRDLEKQKCNLEICQLVHQRGGLPKGKEVEAFCESVRVEWNKGHPEDAYSTWREVKQVYCRLYNRLKGRYLAEGE